MSTPKLHKNTAKEHQHLSFYYAYLHDESDAVSRAIIELSKQLQARGFDTSLLALPQTMSSSLGRGGFQIAYFFVALLDVLRRLRSVDTIITVDVPTGIGLIGRISRKLSGKRIKHIAWILDMYRSESEPRSFLQKYSVKMRSAVDQFSMSEADVVVTLGSCMAALAKDKYGISSTVIPIWQDEKWLAPRDKATSKLGFDFDTKFVVLYSGHAGDRHPLDAVVGAAASLTERPDVLFVIAGKGTSVDEAKLLAQSLGLSNIRFMDAVPSSQVCDLLSAADIHVVTLDNFAVGSCVPSKTYAAMAVGRAVAFIGDLSCQAALDISSSAAGYVIPQNSGGLVRTVLEASNRSEHNEKMGMMGRQFFLRERSLTSQSAKWEGLIRTISSHSGKAS